MSAHDPKRTCLIQGPYLGCADREQSIADLDFVGELATQELIYKARDFCLVAEELTELATFKYERPHGALSNHCRCGRPISQESNFANEVASFQVRDLTARDHDF